VVSVVEKVWTTKAGLLAAVIFQPMGHRCGYVQVSEAIELDYDDDLFDDIEVHGGLTFGDNLNRFEGYWLGFDCAHVGDGYDKETFRKYYGKEFPYFYESTGCKVRDLNYVVDECESLAEQLKSKIKGA